MDGRAVDAGVVIDSEGPTASAISERTTPVISNPITGEWVAGIHTADSADGELSQGLILLQPGSDGSPEHYHPTYEERLEVLEGEVGFSVDGNHRTLSTENSLVHNPGVPLRFWNESTEFASLVGEARPAAKIEDVLTTRFGPAHDGKFAPEGNPPFFQAMAVARELATVTVFTPLPPPPVLQRLLSIVFTPIARRTGCQATYPPISRSRSGHHASNNQCFLRPWKPIPP